MRLVRILPPVLALIALDLNNTAGLDCNWGSCFGSCNKNKSEENEDTYKSASEKTGAETAAPKDAEQKETAISLDEVKSTEGKKAKKKIDKARQKVEWFKNGRISDWQVKTALGEAAEELAKVKDDKEKKTLQGELKAVREEFNKAKQQKEGGTGTGKTAPDSGGGGTGQATGGGTAAAGTQ